MIPFPVQYLRSDKSTCCFAASSQASVVHLCQDAVAIATRTLFAPAGPLKKLPADNGMQQDPEPVMTAGAPAQVVMVFSNILKAQHLL